MPMEKNPEMKYKTPVTEVIRVDVAGVIAWSGETPEEEEIDE